MSGPNIITYKKQYGMGGDKENQPSLEDLKGKAIGRVISHKPILGRFFVDHLIDLIDGETKQLDWNLERLNQLDIGQLLSIASVLDNRYEIEIRTY